MYLYSSYYLFNNRAKNSQHIDNVQGAAIFELRKNPIGNRQASAFIN